MLDRIFFKKVLVTSIIVFMSILSSLIYTTNIASALSLSSLIIAILFGMVLTNIFNVKSLLQFQSINSFFTKEILRIAIILYGFRLTFQDISNIGFSGVSLSFVMLLSTFIFGYFIGVKVLRLDKQLTILISAGSSICGAAAVLATESVLKNRAYKTAIAVSTVVLFGTISMFLYPFLYKLGFFDFTLKQLSLYLGSTLHEVAHVVGSANIISNESVSVDAVISKMIRVLMLAPFLLALCFFVNRDESDSKIVIPWFAIAFIAVAIFNSFSFLEENTILAINSFDDFLLTCSMFVLGLKTDFKAFKEVGFKPLVLAFVLFIWLFIVGIFAVKILII